MSNKEYVKYIAPDLAAKLASDLHSSAEENVISSMLAASLNESEHFMKWLCRGKAGFMRRKRDFGELWAAANDRIPQIVTDHAPACTYQHPDILIWHKQDEGDWDEAFKAKTPDDKKAAMRRVRAVFIEVKKTSLGEDEKEKYKQFVECISHMWRGEKSELVRFVMISSHDAWTAERIKSASRRDRRRADEKRWNEVLKYRRGRVKPVHVTFHDIFGELKQNERAYRGCSVIPLFRSYLALYTAQVDDMSYRKSWEYLVKYHGHDQSGLRREIVNSIRELATIMGISPERVWNLEQKMRKTKLITVIEHAADKYRLSLHDEAAYAVPEDELHLRVLKGRKPIRFYLRDASAGSITEKMRHVRNRLRKLRECQSE